MSKVDLAYLHTGVSVPSLALNVATTLGGEKLRKDVTIVAGVTGLEVSGVNNDTKKSETWIIPYTNVKIYRPVHEALSSKK